MDLQIYQQLRRRADAEESHTHRTEVAASQKPCELQESQQLALAQPIFSCPSPPSSPFSVADLLQNLSLAQSLLLPSVDLLLRHPSERALGGQAEQLLLRVGGTEDVLKNDRQIQSRRANSSVSS
jgi:hypothetical protein